MNDFDEDEQQTNEQAPGSQNKGAQAGDTEPLLANSPTRSDPTGAAPKPPLEAASVVGPNPPAEPVPPAPPAEVSGSIPPAPPAPPAPAGTGTSNTASTSRNASPISHNNSSQPRRSVFATLH